MALLHVCLNVADADRAADWYVSELGFERSWAFETEDGRTRNVYVADENGVELQLSETEGETDLEAGDAWDHLAIDVASLPGEMDSVDAAVESIDHNGLLDGPTDIDAAGARVAFIEAPDGHAVELIDPYDG